MTPAALPSLHLHLSYAVAVTQTLESEFRSFSKVGDDTEVASLFQDIAAQAAADHVLFYELLLATGSAAPGLRVGLASRLPELLQMAHRLEEQIVQRLITAYAACGGVRALYTTIARCAHAADQFALVEKARTSEQAFDVLAARTWALLPTRSLIAYNILTAAEVDPSVETKTGQL